LFSFFSLFQIVINSHIKYEKAIKELINSVIVTGGEARKSVAELGIANLQQARDYFTFQVSNNVYKETF
jgi:hypothetical protein